MALAWEIIGMIWAIIGIVCILSLTISGVLVILGIEGYHIKEYFKNRRKKNG